MVTWHWWRCKNYGFHSLLDLKTINFVLTTSESICARLSQGDGRFFRELKTFQLMRAPGVCLCQISEYICLTIHSVRSREGIPTFINWTKTLHLASIAAKAFLLVAWFLWPNCATHNCHCWESQNIIFQTIHLCFVLWQRQQKERRKKEQN